MRDGDTSSFEHLDNALKERIEKICNDFEDAWQSGKRPVIEPRVADRLQPGRNVLLAELLRLELNYRYNLGETVTRAEYLQRFPKDSTVVNKVFDSAHENVYSVDMEGNKGQPDAASGADPTSEPEFACPPEHNLTIVKELGRGQFGIVYLANDEAHARQVAVKVPLAKECGSPESVKRFLGEARRAAGLEHAGIVRVYDSGLQANSRPYVIMQYVKGPSLDEKLDSGTLPPTQASELLIQLADAAGYAHKREIIHRDLKPANILLDADDRPHIADFGLAVSDQELREKAGEKSGTPAYMAPEQIRGDVHRLDGRCDIWALGVILYEMLAGRRPFDGDTFSQISDEIENRDPKPLRQIDNKIPKRLAVICSKCLKKNGEDRYQSGFDLADDLRAFLRPRNWYAIAAAALLLVAVTGIAVMAIRGNDDQDHSPAANRTQHGDQNSAYKSEAGLQGDVDVLIWENENPARHRLGIRDPNALPLKPGDGIRVAAQLNRAAYVYLLWIDSEGKVFPVYPWEPGDWLQRPDDESPRAQVNLPEQADIGWPMSGGPGMETFLMLARDTPLPPNIDLQQLLAGLPRQPYQTPESIVEFENGTVISTDLRQDRGPQFFNPQQIEDPVLQTHRTIQEKLNSHFKLIRAVSFANAGERASRLRHNATYRD